MNRKFFVNWLVLCVLSVTLSKVAAECACSEPLDPGPCLAYFPRFYYCPQSKTCKPFVYGGCQGNKNNFETFESCVQSCQKNETALPCHQPADMGPCKAYVDRFYFDVDTNKCMRFKYGGCAGNSNNFEQLQDCENACVNQSVAYPPVSTKVCTLPMVTGPCKGSFPRFYYDNTSKSCKQFIYGGCGGNMNNFLSLTDCRKACGSTKDDVCSLPAFTGPCEAYFKRYYFDATTGSCRNFVYGGCQSNGNNFETFEQCQAKCGDPVNPCKLEKKVGPCKAAINRYYFDKDAGKCLLFSWGGCEPNANNFLTLADCQKVCPTVNYTTKKSTTKVVSGNPCSVGVQSGPCFGAFERFFYNNATKTCLPFVWGGCQANANNFKTLEDCQKSCKAQNTTKKKKKPCSCF